MPTPPEKRIYTVQVFRDGEYAAEYGADREHELRELLYTLALRHCTQPREYARSDEGILDVTKPLARPRIEVAIWDSQREEWAHPDGRPGKREIWLLPLTCRVNVGSFGID